MLVLGCSTLLALGPLSAQDAPHPAPALRALGNVTVDAGLFGTAQGLSLDTSAVLEYVDSTLHSLGLLVGRYHDPADLVTGGLLMWKATIVEGGGGVAYSVSLSLSQLVTSPTTHAAFFATSWQATSRTGWAPDATSLRTSLLRNLDLQLREFTAAYRCANHGLGC